MIMMLLMILTGLEMIQFSYIHLLEQSEWLQNESCTFCTPTGMQSRSFISMSCLAIPVLYLEQNVALHVCI